MGPDFIHKFCSLTYQIDNLELIKKIFIQIQKKFPEASVLRPVQYLLSTWDIPLSVGDPRECGIKLNETESIHIRFTNKKSQNTPIRINDDQVPYASSAQNLGITLDARLRWKVHVKKKREKLCFHTKKIYWLIGRNSTLSIYDKLILYK